MSQRHVMITGASTHPGGALIKHLRQDPSIGSILVVDHPLVDQQANGPDELEKVVRVSVDLTRARDIRNLLNGIVSDLHIDTIIHLAHHRGEPKNQVKRRKLNVEGTRELINGAENHPTISKFILKSWMEIYALHSYLPNIIDEHHPLNFSSKSPAWIQERLEADQVAVDRIGSTKLKMVVLRCSDCLCAHAGSQLFNFLKSPVCFRPMGFDPMVNVLSLQDLLEAIKLAVLSNKKGVYTIPGLDTLPLSQVIKKVNRKSVPIPGPIIYGFDHLMDSLKMGGFSYNLNYRRFHFSGVLNGGNAAKNLGYCPQHPIDWDALASQLSCQTSR